MQCFRKLALFETKSLLFVTNRDLATDECRILIIDRQPWVNQHGSEIVRINEIDKTFSMAECRSHLTAMCEPLGLERKSQIEGIMGIIRLPRPALVVVTKKSKIATVAGRPIYSVDEWRVVDIFATGTVDSRGRQGDDFDQVRDWEQTVQQTSAKNRSLLAEINLTRRDFFFSYQLNLTQSIQRQMASEAAATPFNPQPGVFASPASSLSASDLDSKFQWNFAASNEFIASYVEPASSNAPYGSMTLLETANRWLLPLVHGYCNQSQVSIHSPSSHTLTLLARRSRHHAGCRYFRRGLCCVNEAHPANEVETEMILESRHSKNKPALQSFVIYRGSIPLFWSQRAIASMRPPIEISEIDPNRDGVQSHFVDLFQRYGSPIVPINLIRQPASEQRKGQKANESRLGAAYTEAITTLKERIYKTFRSQQVDLLSEANEAKSPLTELPARPQIVYIEYDFLAQREQRRIDERRIVNERKRRGAVDDDSKASVMTDLVRLMSPMSETIGYFSAASSILSRQCGAFRINCIDCLDRTNVTQYVACRLALSRMIRASGVYVPDLQDEFASAFWLPAEIATALQQLFSQHGDRIAHQYAVSGHCS